MSTESQACNSFDGLLGLSMLKPTAAAIQRVVFPLAILLLLLLITCTGYGESRIHSLSPGAAVNGELRGGEVATYAIPLERDEFCFARVMQLSVDLVVTVWHSSGSLLKEIDLLSDGPEFFAITSDTAGDYRVELRPFYPLAPQGNYVVQVLQHRPASHTKAGMVNQLFAEFEQTSMPGASVVVLQDGEIVHASAFGMADLENDVPLTTTTPINICSVGKQLTAFAIALLAERGQLELDDGVRNHLPWLTDFGHQITIRHLIHHTSGLRELDDLTMLADLSGEPLRRNDFRRFVQEQRELNFPPGEQYLYCNTGYILLGEVIESVTGVPFIEWMQANVLEPLGMHDTFFYHDVNAIEQEFAWSYRLSPNGNFQRYEMLPAWYVGAGNAFSSAEDLKRWMLHLESPSICSRRVIERMSQGGKLVSGESTSYAFAQDRTTYRGLAVLEHGGGGWGYRSHIMRFPEHRFATIVVSNFVYGRAFTRSRQIADLFLSEHLSDDKPDDEYVNHRRAIAIDPAILEAYSGTYHHSSGATATITREGNRLIGEVAGLNRLTLYPETDSSFFIKEADLRIAFDTEDRLTVQTGAQAVAYHRNGGASVVGPDLADYEGHYFSEELNVGYAVILNDNQLRVRLPRGSKARLVHVHNDLFRCPKFVMEFDRDDQSLVTSFRVSTERSHDITFRKQ